MRERALEHALWAGAAAALLSGSVALRRAGAAAGATTAAAPFIPAPVARPTADSLAEAVVEVHEHDLFRASREPADPEPVPQPGFATQPPRPPKPPLVLRGLLGGPPWDAVVEGVPGVEGAAVLRAGQPVAGIELRAVRRDTVFLRGLDTTWTLTLRRQW